MVGAGPVLDDLDVRSRTPRPAGQRDVLERGLQRRSGWTEAPRARPGSADPLEVPPALESLVLAWRRRATRAEDGRVFDRALRPCDRARRVRHRSRVRQP